MGNLCTFQEKEIYYKENKQPTNLNLKFKQGKEKVNLNDFQLLKLIGKGSFGKVFLVNFVKEQQLYAMKVIKKSLIQNERHLRHIMTERQILEQIDNQFIVKLRYAFQSDQKLYLVVDFMNGGDLFYHLKKLGKFSEITTKFYAAQIVLGLQHLHNKNIIYRDLKSENIILDSNANAKLADFGLSKMNVTDQSLGHSVCGTPEYLAPEIVLSKDGHDKTVDWWSFGILVYEMLVGVPPFYSNNKRQMFNNLISKQIPFPSYVSKTAQDFICKLLVVKPEKRLGYGKNGTNDVMEHPFFKEINWECLNQRKIKSPLNLNIQKENDIRYFDHELLRQNPIDSPSSFGKDQFIFKNFSYNKNNLDLTGTSNALQTQ